MSDLTWNLTLVVSAILLIAFVDARRIRERRRIRFEHEYKAAQRAQKPNPEPVLSALRARLQRSGDE